MKLKITLILTLFTSAIFAQVNPKGVKYRRSSLYTLMIDDTSRAHYSTIKYAFMHAPFPDKFNNHNLISRSIVSNPEIKKQEKNIDSYLNINEVAKKAVAKWFNRSAKGGFNMNLISERGSYNASEMDARTALLNKRGLALLADAGEELIGNTFVLISEFKYTNKEEVASKTTGFLNDALAASLAQGTSGDTAKTRQQIDAANKVITELGSGYVIVTTSYLYRLNWTDSISSVFYNQYWTDDANLDTNKVKAFNKSNIFTLTYIGSEKSWADVQALKSMKIDEDTLIARATVKAADKVIAKLQRNHEEFRTKSPLININPIAAEVGLKEGVEFGDKFQVLEQVMDENGKTSYNKVGMIKASRELGVWDNRYMAGAEGDTAQSHKYTQFKKVSGGEFYPGMLIRQKN
ncbi:MAG: hypothetical protein IPP32_03785 [Bacteroidetes bacterium]|nr:hypothetical protein [Bacteroidota bacterium]